jgi:hypothetical protein
MISITNGTESVSESGAIQGLPIEYLACCLDPKSMIPTHSMHQSFRI